ncbi:hypothetical protein QAD02_015493 [Eretmocerus hayati]|uniref:Uncharacterized protein n=1 Tax=Eretmocerus hayati TaxID=131215 RepID=A0ACC2PA23_9HYME|nr:hypothetical protein QAD02_015493 [Eretmocerus hayati]
MSKVMGRSNSDEICGLIDCEPPFGSYLCGKYKRSFAYTTLKDRLPVILTQIIDTLSRTKESIAEKYGESALEDVKQITGAISKLKNELVTNKILNSTQTQLDKAWQDKLSELDSQQSEPHKWYDSIWLICECYMYRRVAQEFMNSNLLKSYDPFEIQKQEAYFKSKESIAQLSRYTTNLTKINDLDPKDLQRLIKLDLWGNKCDLSLSSGVVSAQESYLELLQSLDQDILADDSELICKHLCKKCTDQSNDDIIDIVLDNSGYELFSDFCLAVFLTQKKIAKTIRFYVKQYPWFISDVTVNDFHWLIEEMLRSDNEDIKIFGGHCQGNLKNGSWRIEEEAFWTQPYDFSEMSSVDTVLYSKLSQAKLVIFKGDLNYRKLLGDINWEYTTEYSRALRGFTPTNLLSLRTIKADLCVGLPEGKAESLKKEIPNWMETGRFGLIQTYFSQKC